MAIPNINVIRQGNTIKYLVQSECGNTAAIELVKLDRLLILNHTEIDPVFRGQGIGKLLIEACIFDARLEGLKICPECSYAANEFRKNLDWSDILPDTSERNKDGNIISDRP